MADAKAELTELLGPPRPDIVPVPWDRAPEEIGFQFPADYRWLIDTYGQISINGELHVFGPNLRPSQPGAPGGIAGFLFETTSPEKPSASFHHLYLAGDYEEAPYPVLPTPGGLLKWGGTYDNDFLYWLTEGSDPDAWPVVTAFFCTPFEWKRYDGGVVQFLADVCAQRHPDWQDLILAPLGESHAAPYDFRGDWTGWKPVAAPVEKALT